MAIDAMELVNGMASSAINLIIWSQPESVANLASMPELPLQIGIGLMLDKPMIFMVKQGETVPRKVRLIADKIVTVDFEDKEQWQTAIKRAFEEYWEEKRAREGSRTGGVGETREADNADGGEA
jgi:hypothetical protein